MTSARGRPAGGILHTLLADQTAELDRRVSGIRADEPDSVHAARVAVRRMRSGLAAFRPLVDRQVTDPVIDELRWLARTLGEARDLEVVHGRVLELLDEEPPGLVVGPVRARVEASYAAREEVADREVLEALDSERYRALRETLDRLVTDPPWTARAAEPARDVLPPCVRDEWEALRRRVEAIDEAEDTDRAVHDARKRAKRLRYVVEALVPAWGTDARRLAKAAKEVGSLLGERQDAVVTRADLVGLAAEATAAGESGFTYGSLHAREDAHLVRLDRAFERLWARASRPRLRAWLE